MQADLMNTIVDVASILGMIALVTIISICIVLITERLSLFLTVKVFNQTYVQFLNMVDHHIKFFDLKISVEMNQLVGSTSTYDVLRDEFATSFIALIKNTYLYSSLVTGIFRSENSLKAHLLSTFDLRFMHHYRTLKPTDARKE